MPTQIDVQKRNLDRIIDAEVSSQTLTDVVASVDRINLGGTQTKPPKPKPKPKHKPKPAKKN
jgi:hypothetical protein